MVAQAHTQPPQRQRRAHDEPWPLEAQTTEQEYYYTRTGRFYSQQTLATLCSELVREYIDGGFNSDTISIEEEDFYARVAERCKVERAFARSVAHWCGLFIDAYHDNDPDAGGPAVMHRFSYNEFMNLAYDLIVTQDD